MTLYMPIGPPASGKSHLLQELLDGGWLDRDAVVSTDELRTRLTGNVWDQSANSAVFQIVDILVWNRLARGLDVWHDATNLTSEWRRKAVEMAVLADQPIISILMTANDDVCRERNGRRSPPIPEDVMEAMFERRRQIRHDELPGHIVTDAVFFSQVRWSIAL